jgi:GntR family transcriptional regulator
MQLWLARGSEVPIREQVVTQIVLGILSDELPPGTRLPSTREVARRFRIHANTVSAAYGQLERDGWLEVRRGSGVYVRRKRPQARVSTDIELDRLIHGFLRSARQMGVSLAEVRNRVRHWLSLQPPDHFLVVEPNCELRDIVVAELASALKTPVRGCSLDEASQNAAGAVPLVLPSKAEATAQALPPDKELLVLRVRSAPASLAKWLPAPKDALVGIASRSEQFVHLARTMLIAAGFAPEAIMVRDPRVRGWKHGLAQAAGVVCDAITARELPRSCRAICFPIVAEASIADLRKHEEFLQSLR